MLPRRGCGATRPGAMISSATPNTIGLRYARLKSGGTVRADAAVTVSNRPLEGASRLKLITRHKILCRAAMETPNCRAETAVVASRSEKPAGALKNLLHLDGRAGIHELLPDGLGFVLRDAFLN